MTAFAGAIVPVIGRIVARGVPMAAVIFACVHNAGRSQMAAAFFNELADPRLAIGLSAGTQPADRVHPEVIAVMREAGIDLTGVKPALLTEELTRGAQLLVTMGCGEACPFVPGLRREDWNITDPKDQAMSHVRTIRDEIRARVRELVAREGWQRERSHGGMASPR